MNTRLIYNYKQGDNDLSDRIDALNLKLNFGENETLADKISNAVNTAANAEQTARTQAVEDINSRMDSLQDEIDGAISTFFGSVAPTAENYPAESWDEEDFPVHLGDLYYNTENGYCYRWMNQDGEYQWGLVKDSDVTKALADAAAAQATADAAVVKAQGVASAGRHLFVGDDGNVTSGPCSALMLTNALGTKTFVITIGDDGSLNVSEVISG